MTRPRWRLKMSESQWGDQDGDWKSQSLNEETVTEIVWVSMTRPRPGVKKFESQSWDRDHKNIKTKTKVVWKFVETKTHRVWKFYRCRVWASSRLGNSTDIKTGTHRGWKFYRCRDSLILRNFIDFEAEIYRDWDIIWSSRPRLFKTWQKMSRPRLYREFRWSLLCPETLCPHGQNALGGQYGLVGNLPKEKLCPGDPMPWMTLCPGSKGVKQGQMGSNGVIQGQSEP